MKRRMAAMSSFTIRAIWMQRRSTSVMCQWLDTQSLVSYIKALVSFRHRPTVPIVWTFPLIYLVWTLCFFFICLLCIFLFVVLCSRVAVCRPVLMMMMMMIIIIIIITHTVEVLAVSLSTMHGLVTVLAIYRPGCFSPSLAFFSELLALLEQFATCNSQIICIEGVNLHLEDPLLPERSDFSAILDQFGLER